MVSNGMCGTSRAACPAKGDRLQRKVGNEDWGQRSQWHEPLSFDLGSYVAVRFLLVYEGVPALLPALRVALLPGPRWCRMEGVVLQGLPPQQREMGVQRHSR